MAKALFIAATGQHVGKTTVSLGLFSALKKRFERVAFVKPVGQQHVVLEGKTVDKDVVLFRDCFTLHDDPDLMSPVVCTRGFTKQVLDGKISIPKLLNTIVEAIKRLKSDYDCILIEGTGHMGVGSIFGLSNAHVAQLLGIDPIIITEGGLGSSFDELNLNQSLLKTLGRRLGGVILNKVLDDKREMILHYFPKALEVLEAPMFGAIPFLPILSTPTLRDYELLFETQLLTAQSKAMNHIEAFSLAAGSLESFREETKPNELVITPACREDIIEEVAKNPKIKSLGMILTGSTPPSESALNWLKQNNVPTLWVPGCAYDVMKAMNALTTKIRAEDHLKVESSIALVEEFLDIDAIISSANQL